MRRYFASRISLLSSLSAGSSFMALGAPVVRLSSKLNPDWLCAAAILLGTNLSSGLASTLLASASRTAQLASDATPFFSGKLSSTSRYFTCSPSDFSEEVSEAEVFFAWRVAPHPPQT
uniref:Uncharacterized protein n=1 Tax=Arundo donax TaxID=35708 RepID=A0A0A9CXR8_ARUDO